jgi:hypothetical protein
VFCILIRGCGGGFQFCHKRNRSLFIVDEKKVVVVRIVGGGFQFCLKRNCSLFIVDEKNVVVVRFVHCCKKR